jgi:hypothetical protein
VIILGEKVKLRVTVFEPSTALMMEMNHEQKGPTAGVWVVVFIRIETLPAGAEAMGELNPCGS